MHACKNYICKIFKMYSGVLDVTFELLRSVWKSWDRSHPLYRCVSMSSLTAWVDEVIQGNTSALRWDDGVRKNSDGHLNLGGGADN